MIPAPSLPIAAAQYTPTPGDVAGNVARTVTLIHEAARRGARLLLLPELSLIGYDLSLLSRPDVWVVPGDPRLDPLKAACQQTGVTTIIGAALRDSSHVPRLAMLTVPPVGEVQAAFKMHLHGQEQSVFEAGTDAPTVVTVDGWRIALAICFDAAVPAHALRAAQQHMDVYAVSALYVQGEERRLDLHLGSRAMDHRVYALLANHGGTGPGWQSCGQTGTWTPSGERSVTSGVDDTLVFDTLTVDALTRHRPQPA